MRASSIGGLGRMTLYRWCKHHFCVNGRTRSLRAHVKRAAHRSDRQAARTELRNYVEDVEPWWGDDCD